MKNIGKRIEKLKDSIEVNRVSALLLFAKVDEELNSLSVGELTGEQGLGLFGANAGDFFKRGVPQGLAFRAHRASHGHAVDLLLDAVNPDEHRLLVGNRHLVFAVGEATGFVKIVLHHAVDGNVLSQFSHNLLDGMDVAYTAVQ